jgi:peptide/nickel transport system permease protein
MKALAIIRCMPWVTRLAVLVIAANLLIVLFAPLLSPYGETEIVGGSFEPWSGKFLLGTDGLGRNMLTRMFFGIRNTVGLSLTINSLAFVIGGLLGLMAATVGGWGDQAISRIVDVLMAIPQLIFALLILTIFGTSVTILVATVTILDATRFFRIFRAAASSVVVMDFVEVARLRGEGLWWCIRREVLPNTIGPLLAEFGIRFCYVCLFISGLSFLGLGLQPPAADLGSMVRETAMLITFGDITPLLPAGAIALITISVNFLVDWMLQRTSGLKT